MFDKFIELFKVGTHTDSQGKAKTWTNAECKEFADNHNNASIRLGHKDKESYGNIKQAKFENGIVSALFDKVNPTFEQIVASGEIGRRSIGLKKTHKGWSIDHVAFLGKTEPALADLAPIFSKGVGEQHSYQFSFNTSDLDINPWHYQSGMRSAAALFRKIRDFIIDKHDIETADRVLSDWEIEAVDNAEQAIKPKNKDFSTGNTPTTKEDKPMNKEFTQADIEAAKEAAKSEAQADANKKIAQYQKQLDQSVFEKAKVEFNQTVKQAITDGKITPAQSFGMPEFMAQLNAKDEYEFSKSDDDTDTTNAIAWFESFLGNLTAGVEVGKEIDTHEPKADFSAQEIREYANKHNVDVATASAQLKSNMEKE